MGAARPAESARPAAAAAVSIVPEIFLDGGKIPSAVLVAMFEESGETRVILTRRSKTLRFHQGEVSFPGGRCDAGESPSECALREAHEETGLDPGLVSLAGYLSPIATFSSESFIEPVVGVLESRPQMMANPTEVDRVFDVELAALVADGVFREERWRFVVPADGGEPVPTAERRGSRPANPAGSARSADPASRPGEGAADGSFPVWFFELPGDTVWGATARVLMELLRAVLDV
jgi:8-oxo-dGTP pyrophosphatase MutT (NUDIX family)